jgi:hypothetical protein
MMAMPLPVVDVQPQAIDEVESKRRRVTLQL